MLQVVIKCYFVTLLVGLLATSCQSLVELSPTSFTIRGIKMASSASPTLCQDFLPLPAVSWRCTRPRKIGHLSCLPTTTCCLPREERGAGGNETVLCVLKLEDVLRLQVKEPG